MALTARAVDHAARVPPPIYLGLDCSTQSMSAAAISLEGGRREVVFEASLSFDDCFPGYGTRHGVVAGNGPGVVTSSPLMWAEALDGILAVVASALGRDVRRVAAISGSAQQHGSVYLRPGLDDRLARLEPPRPLAGQLEGAFSRDASPVWMDSSTAAQCAEITEALGGGEAVAHLTGSRAFERFTGPQIRRFWQTDPGGYGDTERVHLVSSWMASLLLGREAPIDHGDGSGMNLMDLVRREWSPAALDATAPELRRRLPLLVPSATGIGTLSEHWRRRHGLPAARLVAWTGDNPSSLVGLGVTGEDVAAISLGTSDTVFNVLAEPAVDPHGTAHLFVAPRGDLMSLVCFRNGSLARERVRDRFGLEWSGFSEALTGTPPGNRGALMLPWFEPEITPNVPAATVRVDGLDESDPGAVVRACVEGQMMLMRRHSRWAAPRVVRIHVAGGAARNTAVLQVMADVFQAPVHRLEVGNAACLGAALRAMDAVEGAGGIDGEDAARGGGLGEPTILPDPRTAEVYEMLMERQGEMERRVLEAERG